MKEITFTWFILWFVFTSIYFGKGVETVYKQCGRLSDEQTYSLLTAASLWPILMTAEWSVDGDFDNMFEKSTCQ